MTATATDRVEIDFSVYNPYDADFVRDPRPTFRRMLHEYPVAFHTGIRAWMVSPHDLIGAVLRDNRFSTSFADWNLATPAMFRPREQWNLYDEVQSRSLLNIPPAEHQRLRRLTAPAFARRVHEQIEARIQQAIAGVFDEIDNPVEFNVATQISAKVPLRAIAAMIGVPPDAHEVFEHGLGWNIARASNPLYAADRADYIAGAIPGLELLRDLIAARRAAADPGTDFLGTLVSAEIDGDGLDDLDILALIMALVVAGSDTAVDLHTLAVHTLLTHPDQRRLLREQPELMDNAILELIRYTTFGKLGAIPRFALQDLELEGQLIAKGDHVMTIYGASWIDETRWPDPDTFDITRSQAGNLIFGAGPHLCIGLNLAKAQVKLMINEFEKRFGDSAHLVGEIEQDPSHFNSRRITTMMLRTAP